MGRLLAWISGVVSGIAAYRFVTRRQAATAALPAPPPAEPAPDPGALDAGPLDPGALDPRAEALRVKLEQQEPPVADAAADDPDARRARVHEEARAAVERMRRAPNS